MDLDPGIKFFLVGWSGELRMPTYIYVASPLVSGSRRMRVFRVVAVLTCKKIE